MIRSYIFFFSDYTQHEKLNLQQNIHNTSREIQNLSPTKSSTKTNSSKKSLSVVRDALPKSSKKNDPKKSENLHNNGNKNSSDNIDENQEIKHKKNGKWDAVMSKIAENKSNSKKKNYEIRSKVTCGQIEWIEKREKDNFSVKR